MLALLIAAASAPIASADAYLPTTPVPVIGRILTPDRTGDNANWIEIARNGPYSLILRANYVNWRPNSYAMSVYNNPMYQSVPYGATVGYRSSSLRTTLNNWFNNRGGYQDSLPPTARIRNYTVANSALGVLGTSCADISLRDGFSSPSEFKAGFGDDIAFALSFTESAQFISNSQFMRGPVAHVESNPIAKMNYTRIRIPFWQQPNEYFGMWLRSPGDTPGQAAALCSGTYASHPYDGKASQMGVSVSNHHGMLYPALWVDSSIFESRFPITVNYYTDSIDINNLIVSIPLEPQPAGTYIDADLTLFAPPGYGTPGTRSGDISVAERQNTVNVVYERKPVSSTVYVYYFLDSVEGQPLSSEILVFPVPPGTLIAPLLSMPQLKMPGYLPGKIAGGDTHTKEPFAVVLVVFEKAPSRYIAVVHMIQKSYAQPGQYDYYSMEMMPAADGDMITAASKQIYIPGYRFKDGIPPSIVVSEYQTVLLLRYDISP